MATPQDDKHSLYNVKLPFPFKLYEMLDVVMRDDNQDIVSWQPHGKAFRVHKPREFAMHIMPRHFKQTHYKSFQRQLHIYGFYRIAGKGMRDNGAYYHEMFIQGEKKLSLCMVRQKIKGLDAYDTLKHPDPDFYAAQKQEARQTVTTAASPTTRLESSRLEMIRSERGIIDRVVWNKPSATQTDCSNLERRVQQPKKIIASHDKNSPAIQDLPSPMLVKSSTVGTSLSEGAAAAAMKEGEEMFFAGKRFFFVEPLEETPKWRTKAWRRSSWTARGA